MLTRHWRGEKEKKAMNEIFKKNDLLKPNFFQKLLKQNPKKNFILEIENLLSDNEENISMIPYEKIKEKELFYKVKSSDFRADRERLFDLFLNKCLYDEFLSDSEKKNIDYLQTVLHISEEYAKKRIKEETELIYKNKVEAVIADSKLKDNERADLEKMRINLDISNETGREIYSTKAQEKVQLFVNEIIQKRRMSPNDEEKLNNLIQDLNVNVTFTDNGLQKLKLFWQIESGELSPITCDINIQKSETLYYKTNITWYEERTRTTYVNYGGVSTRFRICKGVYLKTGSIAPSRHTEEYMKEIDSGTVYFTNKRIIFMGNHGNKNIPLTKVLSYTAYNNGIQIEKDTGKSPFFETDDSELMGMYLSRLIADL